LTTCHLKQKYSQCGLISKPKLTSIDNFMRPELADIAAST